MENEEIIRAWLETTKPSGLPMLEFLKTKNSALEATPTGKWYIVKSRYRIVNWWRKFSDTEIVEQEYTYKWKTGYDKVVGKGDI